MPGKGGLWQLREMEEIVETRLVKKRDKLPHPATKKRIKLSEANSESGQTAYERTDSFGSASSDISYTAPYPGFQMPNLMDTLADLALAAEASHWIDPEHDSGISLAPILPPHEGAYTLPHFIDPLFGDKVLYEPHSISEHQ